MSEVWVANASPIIVLGKCGYLDLVTKLCDELWIPQAVIDEILAGPSADPTRRLVESGWGRRSSATHVNSELLEWGLGPGETSVLASALERSPAVAVLDDAAARTCAKAVGVPTIGTLGIILRAKKRGVLPSAAQAMKALRRAGLYLDSEIIRRALLLVNESWIPE